jgi:50S ribosomal subunit-associated GTPase HflX
MKRDRREHSRNHPRWLVCALLSAHIKNPELVMQEMEASIVGRGDEVVGRLLQRRGVSRSKTPGGSNRMDMPLTQRTLFGPGKTQELAALAKSAEASHLLIYNSITGGQRYALGELTGTEVHSFTDDPQFSTMKSTPS